MYICLEKIISLIKLCDFNKMNFLYRFVEPNTLIISQIKIVSIFFLYIYIYVYITIKLILSC